MCDLGKLIKKKIEGILPAGSRVALFDFPNYSNVGDSAIWLGNLKLLEELSVRVVYVDDPNVPISKLPHLGSDIIILLSGGGNFGDLWPRHQTFRESIVRAYPHHRIVQLPQSIHFEHQSNIEKSRQIFKGHKDFHLFVRDQQSYDIGTQLHDGPTVLCPDLALCLGQLSRIHPPSCDILGLLRTDKERVIDDHALFNNSAGLSMADWVDEPSSITARVVNLHERVTRKYPQLMAWSSPIRGRLYRRLAKIRLMRGCELLSRGKVVITDRLHGHILCTMMGIPHVVLDNSYGKVTGFQRAWQTGEGICLSAKTLSEAVDKAGVMVR